jgi:tetratricopeptide (TPR) repeat protein
MPPVSNAHELDTRLLRFRSRPGSEDAHRLANDLLNANRASDALEIAGAGLRAKPEDFDLLMVEGRAELAGGDLLKAQAALLKAARVGATRKEPFRFLGEVLLKRGDPARAAKVLERAKGIDPADRAISALFERANRLAKIAETDVEKASEASRASFEPPQEQGDERTRVAHEVTDRLAAVTREKAQQVLAPHQEPKTEEQPLDQDDDDEVTQIAQLPKDARLQALRAAPPIAPAPVVAPAPPIAPAPVAAPPPMARPPAAALPPLGVPPAAMPAAKLPAPPPPGALRAPAAVPPVPDLPPPPLAAPAPTTPGGFAAPDRIGDGPRQAPSRRPPPPSDARLDDSLDRPPAFGAAPEASEPFGAKAVATDAALALGTDEPWSPPPDDGAPPEPVPDEPVGENAGQPEDPDAILAMLQREGLFEPPTGDAAVWASRAEAKTEKTRIGGYLAAGWVVVLLAAGGGWYGWQEYVRQRHEHAAQLVEQARNEARAGDHEDLVDAERHLREARDLDPHGSANSTVLLFVHAERALEDGAFEVGFLAPTVARAERTEADANYLHAASAVVAAGNGNAEMARTEIAAALAGAPDDAVVLYVAGRLGQRLGGEHALEQLEAATQRDPELAAAAIALAEARYDEGRPEDALTLLDGVLSHDAENFRAKLWRGYFTCDDDEVEAAMSTLTALQPRLEHGAPTDHVLYELTRARLLRRQGHHEEAHGAIDEALHAGASEPRLLALVAQAARAEGRFLQAEYAATEAVRGSPSNADFRKLLAGIYLDRRNGARALTVLTQLSANDPDVLAMIAQASLLVGTDEALGTAAAAIDAYSAEHEDDTSVELRALRIRVAVAGDADPGPALEAARTLARENPGDSVPALALGAAALRAHQAEEAQHALETVVRTSPDDAEGHYLLGRAYRMRGDGENAVASFRRAIELSSDLVDAKVALASLLLDTGDFTGADALYVEIGRLSGSASGQSLQLTGRLGRVESLIGLGRLDDANVQLEGVRGTDRNSASAHLTAAHLAMATGHFGDAVRELRPLTEADAPSVTVLAAFGDALAGAGESGPAGEAYDRALATDAQLPEALLGKAQLAIAAGQTRDATPLLDAATTALEQRVRPPSMRARLLVLRARISLDGHDAAGARALLEQATGLAGAPADAWFYLGEALSAAHSSTAADAYAHYLEMAPSGEHAAAARRASH